MTNEDKSFIARLETLGDRLNPFPQGDEFFGTIRGSSDTRLIVEPLVARDVIRQRDYVSAYGPDGTRLTADMQLSSVDLCPDGMIDLRIVSSNGQAHGLSAGLILSTARRGMDFQRRISARYGDRTITVYQAFNRAIGECLLDTGRFGEGFVLTRSTWVKPSFLWMMNRSRWGSAQNQEMVLRIDLDRACFEHLLENAHVSDPVIGLNHSSEQEFRDYSARHPNCVQWDPDRDAFGRPIERRAIQLGISPRFHGAYEEGIVEVCDLTGLIAKIADARSSKSDWRSFLQIEFDYPTPQRLLGQLEMHHYNVRESESSR